MKYTAKHGFTLIELITVIGLTAVMSVAAVAVLVNSQIRGAKGKAITEVRQEGIFILDQITYLLRNARYVLPNQYGSTCQNGMTAIRLEMGDDGVAEIYLASNDRIASNSGTVITTPPAAYLSGEAVRVVNFSFRCSQAAAQAGALVQVNVTVDNGDPATKPAETYYTEDFTTQVHIRSY